jgi:phosphopantothenoylcysteine decarboxylase/phosphopantothenate--cysteine ligase
MATLMATRAPVIICPAMHTEMWEQPSVQDNLALLARRGVEIVPPESGRLAGGDSGEGRLADPAVIVQRILARLADPVAPDIGAAATADLAGQHIVVSAGGTREALDPVRFITNRSSGKQGHALAEAAARRGAQVTLVTSSPLRTAPELADRITRVPVESAADMERVLGDVCGTADVVIMAAAVADFRPKAFAQTKLSKEDGLPELILEPTPDILAGLAARRPEGQVLVGFAAETHDAIERARRKLVRKGVDLLVVNDVSAPGAGFDHDTNAVSILGSNGSCIEVPLTSKNVVANAVLDSVIAHQRDAPYREKRSST